MGFAQATGFSPTSFTFNLVPNEEECGTIIVDSTSPTISVSDMWAENKDIEWKVSLFDTSASSHGISIDYDKELSINEREVEVCVSGSKLGEYHGVILLKEEQEGNSVIQMGIWIKLIIAEKTQKTQTQENTNQNAGGGGGGDGGGSTTNSTTNSTNTTEQVVTQGGIYVSVPENNTTTNQISEENKNKITGLVTGKEGTRNIIVAILFIIIITGIVIYNTKIRRKKKHGY
ncbi:MAG: hypothetical protein NTZ83_05210 [Candidatus Pacearchaeota archaeon]|nr:hypothetical protein [Candidatus Pacearchaeota archaeon]